MYNLNSIYLIDTLLLEFISQLNIVKEVTDNGKWLFKACPFCGSVDIGIKDKTMGFIAGDGPCVARRQI